MDVDNLAPAGPDQQQAVKKSKKKYKLKTTLRTLSLKAVLEHKTHLILFQLEGLKNLPITLKNLLLKMVVEAFKEIFENTECTSEEMCCFLATLMHKEITTLELPTLNSTLPPMDFAFKWQMEQIYKSHAGEAQRMSLKKLHKESCGVLMLINAIGAQCSNLKSLSIWYLYKAPMIPLTEGSIFGTAFFRVLPRLTKLDMCYYQCGDWALTQIGTHATNLVRLQVGLTLDVTSAGFEALSKLPHLQQFIYGEFMKECDWKHQVRFFRLCTEYLPHLRVAGQSFDVMGMDDLLLDGYLRARGYHNELVQQLKRPATLSLQLLNLSGDVLPEKRIKFSHLEELVFWSPSSRVLEWCDSHASLTALGLYYENNQRDIIPVLRQVGQRLQSLTLCEVNKEFSMAEVLQLCPRLKRFKVSVCKVKQDPVQWPEAAFNCMEEACFEVMNLPPGFLKQILQSGTKLRKFKLSHCGVSNQGMEELIDLIKKTPILPNIASISWFDEGDDCSEEEDEWDWRLLNKLLKTIQRTFPHIELNL